MSLFEARSLCKIYSFPTVVRAVDDITLDIPQGGVFVVTGASGSGKSTLLAMLGALERPTSGQIVFGGTDLTRCSGAALAMVRRRMGFVFQDFALIPHLTAFENVIYPLIPRQAPRTERQRRGEEWLSRFGLESRVHVRAGNLSGGEQQRVAIARAFAGRPEAILADEPTSNLDAKTTGLFLTALQEFQAAGGTAVIASHDAKVVEVATHRREMANGQFCG